MHGLRGVVVLAVLFVATANAASGRRHPSSTEAQSLRSRKTFNTTDSERSTTSEERVNVPKLSTIIELASRVRPQAAFKMWLLSKTHPKDVFSLLQLGEKTMKLDDNPQLLEWFRYGQQYKARAKKPFWYGEVYDLLKKTKAHDADLAQLFESLKSIPGLKKLGRDLQSSLFDDMLVREVKPNELARRMGIESSASALPKSDPRRQIDEDYTMAFLNKLHWDEFFARHPNLAKEV